MMLISEKRERQDRKKGKTGMGLTSTESRVASGCVLGCSSANSQNSKQSVLFRPRGWVGNGRRISRKPNRSQGFLLPMDMEGLQSFDGQQ